MQYSHFINHSTRAISLTIDDKLLTIAMIPFQKKKKSYD